MTTKMTANEKKVLSSLLDNARISDSEIAQKIKISPQGVRKIRLKLEENKISSYRTIINYKELDLNVFGIANINIIDPILLKSKHIIGAFEINETNITHILILGFSSIEEMDKFKKTSKNKAQIHSLHVISSASFLKNSPVELIKNQLKSI